MPLIETQKGGRPLYRVRWNYRPRTVDGKPYDEQDFRNLDDAIAHHRRVNGTPLPAKGKVRVHHVLDAYVQIHAAQLDASTRADMESAFRLHVKPGIGHLLVENVTPAQLAKYRTQLTTTGFDAPGPPREDGRKPGKRRARPVSAPTANKAIRYLKAAMRWARSDMGITTRVFDDMRTVRDKRARGEKRATARAYTDAEVKQLVAGCATLMEATIVLFGKDCGLRRGELFALTWSAIDLDAGMVSVVQALDADNTFKDPKTHEWRTVPIFDDGLKAIREWAKVAPDNPLDLVFCTHDGRPLDDSWEQRHAGKYVTRRPTAKAGTRGADPVRMLSDGIRKRSGIHLELNHLRDTFAHTLLVIGGASAAEVTLALGHESVETTRRHYLDWMEPSRAALQDRVNQARKDLRKGVVRRAAASPRSSPRSR